MTAFEGEKRISKIAAENEELVKDESIKLLRFRKSVLDQASVDYAAKYRALKADYAKCISEKCKNFSKISSEAQNLQRSVESISKSIVNPELNAEIPQELPKKKITFKPEHTEGKISEMEKGSAAIIAKMASEQRDEIEELKKQTIDVENQKKSEFKRQMNSMLNAVKKFGSEIDELKKSALEISNGFSINLFLEKKSEMGEAISSKNAALSLAREEQRKAWAKAAESRHAACSQEAAKRGDEVSQVTRKNIDDSVRQTSEAATAKEEYYKRYLVSLTSCATAFYSHLSDFSVLHQKLFDEEIKDFARILNETCRYITSANSEREKLRSTNNSELELQMKREINRNKLNQIAKAMTKEMAGLQEGFQKEIASKKVVEEPCQRPNEIVDKQVKPNESDAGKKNITQYASMLQYISDQSNQSAAEGKKAAEKADAELKSEEKTAMLRKSAISAERLALQLSKTSALYDILPASIKELLPPIDQIKFKLESIEKEIDSKVAFLKENAESSQKSAEDLRESLAYIQSNTEGAICQSVSEELLKKEKAPFLAQIESIKQKKKEKDDDFLRKKQLILSEIDAERKRKQKSIDSLDLDFDARTKEAEADLRPEMQRLRAQIEESKVEYCELLKSGPDDRPADQKAELSDRTDNIYRDADSRISALIEQLFNIFSLSTESEGDRANADKLRSSLLSIDQAMSEKVKELSDLLTSGCPPIRMPAERIGPPKAPRTPRAISASRKAPPSGLLPPLSAK